MVEQRSDRAGLDPFEAPFELFDIARHRALEPLLGEEQAADVEADFRPGGEAESDDDAHRLDRLDALGQHVAAQIVDDHVGAPAAGPRLDVVDDVLGAGVDDEIRARLSREIGLGVIANRRGDLGAERLGDLDQH